MESIKEKIGTIVREYKTSFPDEYNAFKSGIKGTQNAQRDGFGTMNESDLIERILIEKPETLHAMLVARLSVDEYKWLATKPGARWFARTFPSFKVVEKV